MISCDDFSGKTVVVTGSTSGIGAGIALEFAQCGARVVINGFGDANDIKALIENLKDLGAEDAFYCPADLTKSEDCRELIKNVTKRTKQVDILINNAGMQHVAAVKDFPENKWDAIIALNLSSVFHLSKAVLPGMLSGGFGRIINIASAHGLVASPFKSAYVSAKHGIVGFTKALALEIAEEPNMTVNAICPGYVKTPLVENQIEDQAKNHGISTEQAVRDIILAAQPSKRFVEIDHLVAMARFMASDAGRSMNGAAVTLDGGWTAR